MALRDSYACSTPIKAVALPLMVVAPLVVAFGQGEFPYSYVCCRCSVAAPYAGSRLYSGLFPNGVGWARWANFEGATALLSGFPAACLSVMPSGVCGCVLDLRRLRLPFPLLRLVLLYHF